MVNVYETNARIVFSLLAHLIQKMVSMFDICSEKWSGVFGWLKCFNTLVRIGAAQFEWMLLVLNEAKVWGQGILNVQKGLEQKKKRERERK